MIYSESKKLRTVFIGLLTVGFVLTCTASVFAAAYVGSKRSNKYHYPDCRWARKIKTKNKIIFNTVEETRSKGYIPCKVCKPPLTD